MVKYILLTGHTGFLGSVIYRELKKEFTVRTMGRNEGCDYVVDFSCWDGDLEISEPVEAIVHVAGLAHNKAHSPDEMQYVNVTAVDLLLKIAQREGIKNFIFISSVSVYGKDYGLGIAEDSELNPQNSYGYSKMNSESLVSNWGKENKASFLSLRLPLIVGPNPPGNLGRLIQSIKQGRYIYLKGNKATKSIVFASDVSVFIKNWLSSSEKRSGPINLSNGTAPTFNWIEKAIPNESDKSFRISLSVTLLWNFVVFMRKYLRISLPFIGKLFYPLTFSDELARTKYGYTSKELNQNNFKNELNSNS